MRLRLPFAMLAIATLASACDDNSRPPLPTQPPSASPIVNVTAIACDAEGQRRVRTIIRQLYANNQKTRDGLLKKFDDGLGYIAQGKTVEGFTKFTDIIKKVEEDYPDKLASVSPSKAELVEELVQRLFVCAGYEPPPEFPLEGDVIVGVIDDPTKEFTFRSTDGDYLVNTQAGMFKQPVVILGEKLPDLFAVQVNYDEYRIKTEITANPPGMENPGTTGIIKLCQFHSDFDEHVDHSFMRLARRHDEDPAVILTYTAAGPAIVCPGAPPPVIGSTGFFSRTLAAARSALRGAGTLAVRAVAPRTLYAASSMVDGGVGGIVGDFGSFYAGVAIPDLGVQSITPIAASPSDPTQVQFDIVVRNTGFGASPASTLRFRPTAAATPFQDISIPAMLAGTSSGPATVTVTTQVFTLAAGNYTATATADFTTDEDDPNGAVDELNETAPTPFDNNSATQEYTVSGVVEVPSDINMLDESGMANAGNVALLRNIFTYSTVGARAAGTVALFDVGRAGAILCTDAVSVPYCPAATGPVRPGSLRSVRRSTPHHSG